MMGYTTGIELAKKRRVKGNLFCGCGKMLFKMYIKEEDGKFKCGKVRYVYKRLYNVFYCSKCERIMAVDEENSII